jgi:hypothetical protein
VQVEIDLARYPAAKFGDSRFDVPSTTLGGHKKALREVLRRFAEVETAYLLLCEQPAWGDRPHLIVSIESQVDTQLLYSAWKPHIPEFGVVGFFAGSKAFSAYTSYAATPFYRREHSPPLPAPFSKAELMDYIRRLPDVPALVATAAHLESLKENYDDLPPEQAAAEYKTQQMEMEQTFETLRSTSTHLKAKTSLLKLLGDDVLFGLVLRTFSTETITGPSLFGKFRGWRQGHPMDGLLAQISPLLLVGIANPHDPFPLADVPLLECPEDWLRVVRCLLALAAIIFVFCDHLSPGVASEFLALQAAEREDHTFIVLPGPEQEKDYGDFYTMSLAESLDDPGPEYSELLRRKVSTFGLAVTVEEVKEVLQGARGPAQ